MSANSIKFSENSGNSGQNVQYFSQMGILFETFPVNLLHLCGDFSENLGNYTQNTHSCSLCGD